MAVGSSPSNLMGNAYGAMLSALRQTLALGVAPVVAPAPAASQVDHLSPSLANLLGRLHTWAESGPMLRLDTHGEPIKALQNRLHELGYDPGKVDGDFGPQTEQALMQFQRRIGLMPDGVVGPETWDRLGLKVQGEVRYGSDQPAVAPIISGNPLEVAQRFVAAAQRFKGIPYLYGGGHAGPMTEPGRVDCSGLVLQAARMAGFNLDGCAADQQRMGRPIKMSELQPGDLVFRGTPAHHVGIYLGQGLVLHAPHTGDVVRISSVTLFENARRVIG